MRHPAVVFVVSILLCCELSAQSFIDCNSNGEDDAIDILERRESDCNDNGIPDSCDLQDQRSLSRFRGHSIATRGFNPRRLQVEDLDADGDADLVHPSGHGFEIFWNDGSNGFVESHVDYNFDNSPSRFSLGRHAIADVHGDSLPDLSALATSGETLLALYRNLGQGQFAPPALVHWPNPARAYRDIRASSILTGDLNSDGAADFVVEFDHAAGTHALSLISDGLGGFSAAPMIELAGPEDDLDARIVALADFDGDGSADLLRSRGGLRPEFRILWNLGDGRFGPAVDFGAGPRASHVQVADLQGDGFVDILVQQFNPGGYIAAIAGPDRNFENVSLTTNSRSRGEWIDMNHDGFVDRIANGAIHIQRTLGVFEGAATFPESAGLGRVFADLDSDDDVDQIFLQSDSIVVDENQGEFQFTRQAQVLAPEPTALAHIPFRSDNSPGDSGSEAWVVASRGSTILTFLVGERAERHIRDIGIDGVEHLAAGDFDGDGFSDLAVIDPASSDVLILWGSEAGFDDHMGRAIALSASQVVATEAHDLDGDGQANLVVLHENGDLAIFVTLRERQTSILRFHAKHDAPKQLAVADLDDDGITEILIASDDSVHALWGDGFGSYGRVVELIQLQASASITAITTGDLDLDGDADILVAESDTRVDGQNTSSLRLYRHDLPEKFGLHEFAPVEVPLKTLITAEVNSSNYPEIFALSDESLLRFDRQGDGSYAESIALSGLRMVDLSATRLKSDDEGDSIAALHFGSPQVASSGLQFASPTRLRSELTDCNDNGLPDQCDLGSEGENDRNTDGIPDDCQFIGEHVFIRGDCNGDGTASAISDAVYLLSWLALGGPAPPCYAACDVDESQTNNITDAVYWLSFNFLGGPPPAAPYPDCGPGFSSLPDACLTRPPNCPGI